MRLNKTIALFLVITAFTLIISFENVYADETIEVEIKYTNGDRADFSGMKFVVYKDFDKSPILKSQDNSEWIRETTNDQGKTIRYWIQSTVKQDDHYTADVYLGELFLTSFSPIKLQPGISTNQKIITNVPKIVEELITINLYEESQKITSADGKYNVILRNLQENETVTSNVNFRGDAQFSSLKSGTYSVKITSNNELENILWPETTIQITGDVNRFNILKNSMNMIEQEHLF